MSATDGWQNWWRGWCAGEHGRLLSTREEFFLCAVRRNAGSSSARRQAAAALHLSTPTAASLPISDLTTEETTLVATHGILLSPTLATALACLRGTILEASKLSLAKHYWNAQKLSQFPNVRKHWTCHLCMECQARKKERRQYYYVRKQWSKCEQRQISNGNGTSS